MANKKRTAADDAETSTSKRQARPQAPASQGGTQPQPAATQRVTRAQAAEARRAAGTESTAAGLGAAATQGAAGTQGAAQAPKVAGNQEAAGPQETQEAQESGAKPPKAARKPAGKPKRAGGNQGNGPRKATGKPKKADEAPKGKKGNKGKKAAKEAGSDQTSPAPTAQKQPSESQPEEDPSAQTKPAQEDRVQRPARRDQGTQTKPIPIEALDALIGALETQASSTAEAGAASKEAPGHNKSGSANPDPKPVPTGAPEDTTQDPASGTSEKVATAKEAPAQNKSGSANPDPESAPAGGPEVTTQAPASGTREKVATSEDVPAEGKFESVLPESETAPPGQGQNKDKFAEKQDPQEGQKILQSIEVGDDFDEFEEIEPPKTANEDPKESEDKRSSAEAKENPGRTEEAEDDSWEPSGLWNYSNNCYANSIIQCFRCLPIATDILSRLPDSNNVAVNNYIKTVEERLRKSKDKQKQPSPDESKALRILIRNNPPFFLDAYLAKLYRDMLDFEQNSREDVPSPWPFLQGCVRGLNRPADHSWHGYNQQDSPEFLRGLFMYLQGLTAAPHVLSDNRDIATVLRNQIEISLRRTITCRTCGNSRQLPVQTDTILTVPMVQRPKGQKQVTLQACIDKYREMTRERLECPQCNGNQDSDTNMGVHTTNEYVFVCLTRARVTRAHAITKDNTPLEFPQNPVQIDPDIPQRYEPIAVIEHQGRQVSQGHYTCFRRIRAKWWHLNDRHVTDVTGKKKSTRGYVVLLRRMS